LGSECETDVFRLHHQVKVSNTEHRFQISDGFDIWRESDLDVARRIGMIMNVCLSTECKIEAVFSTYLLIYSVIL